MSVFIVFVFIVDLAGKCGIIIHFPGGIKSVICITDPNDFVSYALVIDGIVGVVSHLCKCIVLDTSDMSVLCNSVR